MKNPTRFLFFILVFNIIFGKVNSQTISQLDFFAPLPSTFDMVYSNDHLVVSQQHLITFDVSDPTDPQMVGQVLYPGSYAYQIAVEGNHAYMAMGGNGIFAIYNITDFSSPWLTGSVSIPATAFLLGGDLAPFGDYVYMSAVDTLYVIDVSDSSAPQLLNSMVIVNPGFNGAGPLAIDGNTLFITTDPGLQIYDISDPVNPAFLTSISNTQFSKKGISVDTVNHRVFLPWISPLQTHLGYDAYDVSDPVNPVFLFSDSTTFGGGEFGETTYFNNVLIISRGGGVTAFDASPFNHHFVTSFTGQDVANSSVALDIRDSVFFNARGSGFEDLLYSGGFPTAIANASENDFRLSPNPVAAGNELNISFPTSAPGATIILRNQLGSQVMIAPPAFFNNRTIKLNLPATMQPGIYFLSITGENDTYTRKLVVE